MASRNDEALREIARDIHHDLEQAVLVDCDGATNYKVRQIILNRLRAATLTPRPEPAGRVEWQPIETAPRNGTRVLLHIDGVDRPVLGEWSGAAWLTIDGHDWTGRNVLAWHPMPQIAAHAPQEGPALDKSGNMP